MHNPDESATCAQPRGSRPTARTQAELDAASGRRIRVAAVAFAALAWAGAFYLALR
ncbi:hypothetical protein PVT71_27450 (plasmid) [Salipiger sp. H15]|uniref:EamA family transporter n=1 Tax=Alloyangia sp. H15 TaxID=3029062 RepID=A0AAU8ASH8_9RHOB